MTEARNTPEPQLVSNNIPRLRSISQMAILNIYHQSLEPYFFDQRQPKHESDESQVDQRTGQPPLPNHRYAEVRAASIPQVIYQT